MILLSGVVRQGVLLSRVPRNHPGKALISRTLGWGLAIFAGGFAMWNVDNVFCTQLRRAREMMGVWGFLLEGE